MQTSDFDDRADIIVQIRWACAHEVIDVCAIDLYEAWARRCQHAIQDIAVLEAWLDPSCAAPLKRKRPRPTICENNP